MMTTSSRDYILFIDESGKSELSDDGSYFLLCGVVISKDLHSALSSFMVSLKDKYNISTTENIHAFDLFEDETFKSKKIPHKRIKIFFDRLTSITEGANMWCLIFRINKTPYLEFIRKVAKDKNSTEKAVIRYLKRNNLHDFLYESLARKVILEFGHFLEVEDAHGEIIAESRRQEDNTVLKAFLSATIESTFRKESKYKSWSKSAFKRIHSLTFQNKKGLSFGLEIADLFGWAYFNTQYGRRYPIKSKAKIERIEYRLSKVNEIMDGFYKKKPEDMSKLKIKTIAEDRVSEFTKRIGEYTGFNLGLFGDPTG